MKKSTSSFNAFFPPHIYTHFSSKGVDFTCPEGCRGFSEEQLHYIREETPINPNSIVQIHQVHGRTVIDADHTGSAGDSVPDGDALITRREGVALAVRTADCLPIYVYDPKECGIALIHAGWKGTRDRITAHTVEEIAVSWGTRIQQLKAAFGPAIGPCCYEVSEEFKEFFPEETHFDKDRLVFDLKTANRKQLLEMGVSDKNIMVLPDCTHCDTGYYSYRRQGKKAGRHIALMMIDRKE